MRRSDRQVTGFAEIVDILSRCDTVRLAVNGDPYPYVVPLSFGFEADDGQITIYFHGAKEGLKHDLIKKDNNVCVEASICHKFTHLPEVGSITTEYESIIGFGKAEVIEGDEAMKGLDLICEHAGFKNFDLGGEKVLEYTRVYKVKLDSFTAKRRFV